MGFGGRFGDRQLKDDNNDESLNFLNLRYQQADAAILDGDIESCLKLIGSMKRMLSGRLKKKNAYERINGRLDDLKTLWYGEDSYAQMDALLQSEILDGCETLLEEFALVLDEDLGILLRKKPDLNTIVAGGI